MPNAAVPAYLGHDFREASPGMRFGLLLPIWTNRQDQEADVRERAERRSREGQEVADMLQRQGMDATITSLRQRPQKPLPGLWDKNDFAAKKAWDAIKLLNKRDRDQISALATRQSALAATVAPDSLLRLDALATAPFTTGLGNEHPLENGFAFLNPYGLPYLPGSGVKGVLRQAARELASGEWGDPQGWDAVLPSPASGRWAGGEGLSAIDALFGKEDSNDAQRGALVFWDVIPQIKCDSLMVEIMTPHQGHYYQQKEAAGSTSPHDSGQPIPISYLTVPPGSGFAFHVVCDLAFLGRIAPALAESWKVLLTAAFEHAFQWLGFGAKTAVGYGAMQADKEAAAKAAKARRDLEVETERARQEAERQARLATLTPNLRLVDEFKAQAAQRAAQLGTHKDKPNTGLHSQASQLAKTAHESNDWSADEKRALAQAIEEWLPKLIEKFDRKDDWKEVRKKLKLAALKGEA
jgi:CRISPR-associated protein Cmr6